MLWEYPVEEIKTPIFKWLNLNIITEKLTINHSIFARIKLFVKHCLDQGEKMILYSHMITWCIRNLIC